jgi:hypothetical protein
MYDVRNNGRICLMFPKALISALALTVIGMPAVSGPVSTIMLFRDSDGIVISVNNPVVYYGPPIAVGGVYYTLGGHVIEFSASPGVMNAGMASDNAAPTAQVGGVTYKVESSGDQVWLRDPATGQRYATERRVAAAAPDAAGLKVNPVAYALD